MMNRNSCGHRHRELDRSQDENATVTLVALMLAVIGLGLYLLVARYHIRAHQILELSFYLIALAATLLSIAWYIKNRKKRKENLWPRPPVVIPMLQDAAHIKKAHEENAIVPGYMEPGPVWQWSDDVRRMQAALFGLSGSGKTTLLQNIAAQDISRKTHGRPRPVIIINGKGDQEFLEGLLPAIASTGRMHQLRVLDPFRPDISVRFNPLYSLSGSRQELVNTFFESFALRQDFFRGHQATYLSDICRVLDYTGKIYDILDVLVMARDEAVMKEQITQAQRAVESQTGSSRRRRQNLEMSVRNLLQSLGDRERVQKIQGLLNELMTFTDDDLSVITNAYEDLLTLDDVVEQNLILYVSLNPNKNTRAVTALGRMLLQSLQLMVGERYQKNHEQRQKQAMVSVLLDEFVPFAYANFAQTLQTARGSNIALLFSLQSIPQLRKVCPGFCEDVSSAPNTVMLMRTRDEETAQFFLKASARVPGQRRTLTVERKGILEERYQEIGWGSVTEIEKTRAVDFQIKNLPVGQMQVLITDNRRGTLHLHVHVRRPQPYRLASFEPVLYPRLHQTSAPGQGANLRFKNADLSVRMARIFGRNSWVRS